MSTSDRMPDEQELALVAPMRDIVGQLLTLEPDRCLVMLSFLFSELTNSVADRFVVATQMGLGIDSVDPRVSLLGDGLTHCENVLAVTFELMNDEEAIETSNALTQEAIELGQTLRKLYLEGEKDA